MQRSHCSNIIKLQTLKTVLNGFKYMLATESVLVNIADIIGIYSARNKIGVVFTSNCAIDL